MLNKFKYHDIKAAAFLLIILNILFFPTLWGHRTLLLSARDAPSVMPMGAFHQDGASHWIGRTPDPGAPAWQSEPALQIISRQYLQEHILPLWNPYAAYGKPLAAAQLAQPFYPLTFLASLHVTPRSYDFFLVGRLFAGGLLMFFFARQFFTAMPSLVAAVSFMLSGYFIVVLNMPHLSVELLAPGILLTFEQILRRNSWLAMSLAAVMIFCAVMGGMPESLFLVVSFGCVFFLFRLVFEREYRARPIGRLVKFVVALTLGFGLSAFLLLPFAELVGVAHDTHQVVNLRGEKSGLVADGDWHATVLYLLPLLFGPVLNSIFGKYSGWVGMWGYWGLMPCLFALTAVLRSLSLRGTLYPEAWRRLTAFFAISLALMLLKRFGSPVINWIGALPIADLILYLKYDEPLMALCIAMLAATGFALIAERRVTPYNFPFAAMLLALVMLSLAVWSLPRILPLGRPSHIFYGVLAAGVLVIVAAVIWFALTARLTLTTWRMPGLLALLILELFATFPLPSFYLFNTLPTAAANPYAGAPYLDFLQAQNHDYARVFGRDGDLFPNWAGVFGLADVRSLEAIEYRPYYKFIRGFLLQPADEDREHGDLADRFTGADPNYRYDFTTDRERRFLALSSIKYLISPTEYGVSSRVVDDMLAQHQSENIWGFGKDAFPIGGGHEAMGLFEHPPSSRITYRVKIDPIRPVLTGVLSMKAAAQDRSDGVGFTLEIKSGNKIEPLFHTGLDPRDVPADRDGHPFRVDLSRYAGQEVDLLFSTDPGPSGKNAFDWAGWARLQFVSEDNAGAANDSPLKKIYDREVYIYQFDGALPRAALYSSAEILPEDEVLPRLKSESFNPEQKLILSRESIPAGGESEIGLFSEAAAAPVRAARITAYQSQHVQIEADTDTPALLMLNDTDYPGWQAHVNGISVPIMRADYLFRGIVIPAGKSTVEFDYEPRSFRLGAEISAVSLVALIALPLATRRRRNRIPAA